MIGISGLGPALGNDLYVPSSGKYGSRSGLECNKRNYTG